MDINQAFIILNLKHDACLEDAKDSFRTLAKRYHPDKLRTHTTKASANDKMKEINLAFQILKKTLKKKDVSKPKIKKPIKTTTVKRTSSLKRFDSFLKKIHKKFLKKTKIKVGNKEPNGFNSFKSTNKKQNITKKDKTFDSVLNKSIKSSLNKNFGEPELKNPNSIKLKHKIKIKNSYSKYIQLKHKMRSDRKDQKIKGFAPIEKISPISPIKKIWEVFWKMNIITISNWLNNMVYSPIIFTKTRFSLLPSNSP